jgi:hypothetical protein
MSGGTEIEIYAPLAIAPAAARNAVTSILEAIANHTPPYERVAISLGLADLHLPVQGMIAVPVHAEIKARPLRWECRIAMEAETNQNLFPKFEGTITVTPSGQDASELWLQGSYRPPLGVLGAGIDASLLHGTAERSLRRFLDWLAGDVRAHVQRAEHERELRARSLHQS